MPLLQGGEVAGQELAAAGAQLTLNLPPPAVPSPPPQGKVVFMCPPDECGLPLQGHQKWWRHFYDDEGRLLLSPDGALAMVHRGEQRATPGCFPPHASLRPCPTGCHALLCSGGAPHDDGEAPADTLR